MTDRFADIAAYLKTMCSHGLPLYEMQKAADPSLTKLAFVQKLVGEAPNVAPRMIHRPYTMAELYKVSPP